jgi:catechol 2,3-dioxygenase-like lactoylglutathione lyase family enzyme
MNKGPKDLIYIAPVFQVADIARSLSFYRDQLGFGVDFVFEGFYAGVSRDGCHIHLKHSTRTPRDQKAFAQEEHIDVCIGVGSAEELSASFTAAAVPFVVRLRHVPYGTEFYVHDPDGYVLAFVQSAPTSHDRKAERGNAPNERH